MFGRNNKLDVDWLSKVGFFDQFTTAQVEQIAHLGIGSTSMRGPNSPIRAATATSAT